MPIRHYLVVLLVGLAVPLQSTLASCQCFQETAASPEIGYLDLVPVPCSWAISGWAWLKVAPDPSTGEPNPPMHVLLRSSRTFNGCHFLNYNSAWPNGPSKVQLGYGFAPGCESNPPSLVFNYKLPCPPPLSASISCRYLYPGVSHISCEASVFGGVEPEDYRWRFNYGGWLRGDLTEDHFRCSSYSRCTISFRVEDMAGQVAESSPVTCANGTCW